MRKIKFVIISESILFVLLMILGLIQLCSIDMFWIFSLEQLINLFVTASLGIIGLYISINIIENNTWRRRRFDFLEKQLDKLMVILDSNIAKLEKCENKYPLKQVFLSQSQKIRDIISNVEQLKNNLDNVDDIFANLKKNFDLYNTVTDYYDHDEVIEENKIKINQRREDMIQNCNELLLALYKQA